MLDVKLMLPSAAFMNVVTWNIFAQGCLTKLLELCALLLACLVDLSNQFTDAVDLGRHRLTCACQDFATKDRLPNKDRLPVQQETTDTDLSVI